LAILALALVFSLVASVFFATKGHFSVDEAIYHMMARSFSANADLSVWNGYQEFPSPELKLPLLRVHDGRLFAQYPHLSTILVTPLYWLFGYQSLFILNALAIVGVVGLCLLIARALFQDNDLALNACLILTFASFAWQYSQAAWPHALSTLFVTGSVFLTVTALRQQHPHKSLSLAAAAGMVAGFGLGVRLDTVFVLPAIVLPFVFIVPWRPWHALAACLGSAPGLSFLAIANTAKFGTLAPFSYGVAGSGPASGLAPYLPIAVLGLSVVAISWLATRPRGRSWLGANRLGVVLGAAVVLIAAGSTPPGWQLVSRFASGSYQLVVDFRIRDPALVEPALLRSPSGSMVYIGALKKALLQSCPYLSVLALPLARLLRGEKETTAIALLFLVPSVYIGVYAYFAWHGGQALNLRYFLPILPFTSILTAYAWRELHRNLTGLWRGLVIATGAIVLAAYLSLVLASHLTLAQQESVFLTLPLILALTTLILLGSRLFAGAKAGQGLQAAACASVAAGLVWAGMVALANDAPRAYLWRQRHADLAHEITPRIAPDSIIFVPDGGWFFGLLEKPRLRLATPSYDDYRDFRALVDFHLDAGRPVYLWLDPRFAATIEERGLLDALQTQPLYEHQLGVLVRVVAPHETPPRPAPSG
jgi:hypothetical protein